jgi:biotin carboxyl carrier protein
MHTNNYKTDIDVSGIGTWLASELEATDIRILEDKGVNKKISFNNKSYDVYLKNVDIQNKTALINVDGFDYNVKMKEPLDHLINDMGFLKASKHSVKEIKSPMPGLVVNIFVAEGQIVAEGDKLLSLEAMKMENILKSPGEGTIKCIKVEKGNSVDKNQILVIFE